MSRRRDRDRLIALLQDAWSVAKGEAGAVGAPLDRWDLTDSVFDLLSTEAAGDAFQDELRLRWLERERERHAARVRPEHHPACAVCGTSFTAHRSDARYCSPACRQRALRDRRREGAAG